jgi:hypothetical protein
MLKRWNQEATLELFKNGLLKLSDAVQGLGMSEDEFLVCTKDRYNTGHKRVLCFAVVWLGGTR